MSLKRFRRRPQEKHLRGARRKTVVLGAVAMLATAMGANVAAVASPPPCSVRLRVELTPDVPNPRDVGFLSSLLGDQVSYLLSLRRERSDSLLVLELSGPGPDYRCNDAIESIRKDGRVLSVQVIQAPS
ncbi:MAG: hypothetical protein JWN85_5143 [Gammaproteobacteria bacterium]|nr:hypothetical protein [Gammaproteobacteria bacterium]